MQNNFTSSTMTEQQQQQRTAEIAATLIDAATIAANSASAASNSQQQPQLATGLKTAASTTTTASAATATTTPTYTTLLSMVGMGTDNNSDDVDATVAAVKAVRDALDRVQYVPSQAQTSPSQPYRLHIRLGAPVCRTKHQVMRVNPTLLRQALPPHTPLLPVDVETGGLRIPNDPGSNSNSSTCVVVACVTLQQQQQQQQGAASRLSQLVDFASGSNVQTNGSSAPTPAPPQGPGSGSASAPHLPTVVLGGGGGGTGGRQLSVGEILLASQQQPPPLLQVQQLLQAQQQAQQQQQQDPSQQVKVPTTWAEVEAAQQPKPQQQQGRHNFRALPLQPKSTSSSSKPQAKNGSSATPAYGRTDSIDMLARISSEMMADETAAAATDDKGVDTRYKKLPPGTTPKNHKRLFVKHSYRDHSHTVPTLDDLEVELTMRTPSAIFPLKLHEVLTEIENDGLDSIVGWLCHGRSFKIHKHKEFVDIILPKYFVMTKKSSFLRQLNLYGFNRLSGPGYDQGSYYHEKFLRGMKFLTKTMQRQKVNGNGIRAAGNPDDEPILSNFPVCPPARVQQQQRGPPRPPKATSASASSSPHNTRRSKAKKVTASSVTLSAVANAAATNTQRAAAATKPTAAAGAAAAKEDSGSGKNSTNSSSNPPQASFPLKLQRILDKLESEGNTDIVSWLSHGRAFQVHDPDRFVEELMPVYFNQTKFSSFQRQLHMYHFLRITAGRDKGAYHHENFQRGRPDLSIKMQRTRVNGKGTRQKSNPNQEPDLYSLLPLPVIAPGTKITIPLDLPPVGKAGAADDDEDAIMSGDDSAGSWEE